MFHCNYETSVLLRGCQPDGEASTFCLCDQTAAASTDFVTEHNIGFIIKASGDRDSEQPPAYGENHGTQLPFVNFLVHHWPCYGSLPKIADDCCAAWQAKKKVMIHCGTGLDLTPGMLAALMWQLARTPPPETIKVLHNNRYPLAGGYL